MAERDGDLIRVAAGWLGRRAENIAVILLAVMFATFIVQIVSRYLLRGGSGNLNSRDKWIFRATAA